MDALIFPPQVVGNNKYDRVEGRIVKHPIAACHGGNFFSFLLLSQYKTDPSVVQMAERHGSSAKSLLTFLVICA